MKLCDSLMKKAGLGTGLTVAAVPAFAALPASVNDMFAEIGTDIVTLGGLAWVAMLAGLGILISMKLTKRFGNQV